MPGGRNGEEGSRGADADGRPPPQSPPSSPPRSSSSPPVTESKVKKLRDRVSLSSSSGARPSCWGSIRIHRIGGRSRGRTGSGEHDTAPAVRTISSRMCAGNRGRCGCRGKANAAVGARSLLQRNDFYCDDCNTHR
ncbi:hypothetical protein BAE44_0009348 [Dichanthelium oligosanthes]|uniref:Uncharacterized protein n=1 Tax=Dichanthelium oligosanthes TaxID=888268 RepID=A0A1E5VWZ5_9POAL|nr:hypothetical protein BAE44_0009348 [Dichanthelium oligosanthes]